jgi:penicillin-binding protein 1C
VAAARQAGSTLKPFLYELAIEERIVTAASLLDDSPVNIVTPAGLYVPQNYDRDFRGLVSLRTALSGSLNVPAVRTLTLAGTEAFVDRLRQLGFETLVHDGAHYGYALALGSAEVTLAQLANAYRSLANGGMLSPLKLVQNGAPKSVRAMDRAASYIVADILADRAARGVTFGLHSPLATRYWSAVKTGTSKDMRDNWCVGFTSRYTVGVWVGNFDGSAMWDVSGVTGAAPLWLEIVNWLHRDVPSRPPAAVAGVERARVRFEAELEPEREELFVAGTAVDHVAAKPAGSARVGILYPAAGQIIAVDPDIPVEAQRVRFQAAAPDGVKWLLDGEEMASSEEEVFWSPVPGRHALSLRDAEGIELDRVEFEVRGALAAAAPATH